MPKEYTPFLKDYWGWIYRSLMFLLRVIISLNGHKGINFENHIVFETSDDLLV
jgi:hypothetical protein